MSLLTFEIQRRHTFSSNWTWKCLVYFIYVYLPFFSSVLSGCPLKWFGRKLTPGTGSSNPPLWCIPLWGPCGVDPADSYAWLCCSSCNLETCIINVKMQNLQNHENYTNYQTFFERASNYVIVNLRDTYPRGGTFSSKLNMEMFSIYFICHKSTAGRSRTIRTMQTCPIHMPSFQES